jgi:diacylglycerol kinase (ATP)
MAKKQAPGLKRILKAGVYSMKGFKAGLVNEAAIRQEMALAVILTIVAFFIADGLVPLILLISFPWLTVAVELLNSGIEAVVDRIGPEWNELSGRAKDMGSAAVFVMLGLNVLVWGGFLLKFFGVISY